MILGTQGLQTELGTLLLSREEQGHAQPLPQSSRPMGFGDMEDSTSEDNPQQIKVRKKETESRGLHLLVLGKVGWNLSLP